MRNLLVEGLLPPLTVLQAVGTTAGACGRHLVPAESQPEGGGGSLCLVELGEGVAELERVG